MALRVSELMVVAWCLVVAAVSLVRPLSRLARVRVVGGAALLGAAALVCATLPSHGGAGAVRNVLPGAFVLGAYWVAGALFVAPQLELEARLLAVDQRVFELLGRRGDAHRLPRWLQDASEVAYLSVYAMLPLGAWAAWAAGGTSSVDRYWTLVFLSEASCYLALAWVQTRPPRTLVPRQPAVSIGAVRRVNELLLTHASIQVNTLPSGHAAGAVAVALALVWVQSPFATVFGLAALAICLATVTGRYHFVVDTGAGAAVAVAWWLALRVGLGG